MRSTKVLSLSLPPELALEAERIAKEEGRTKSELFREALRRYIQERNWRELHHYGVRRAQKRDVRQADVERLIDEYRKDRK